eukprot:TRINITY_DN57573_c0_g1_i1.p1 TRINITY_DN57573_c0_g1~~TRINITY_DN57573_c0_g1_i1.p1  ORF type:complete len:608 (-),score=67.45 TRINITY_DN57573_c0_g1_i1:377-2200(-)
MASTTSQHHLALIQAAMAKRGAAFPDNSHSSHSPQRDSRAGGNMGNHYQQHNPHHHHHASYGNHHSSRNYNGHRSDDYRREPRDHHHPNNHHHQRPHLVDRRHHRDDRMPNERFGGYDDRPRTFPSNSAPILGEPPAGQGRRARSRSSSAERYYRDSARNREHDYGYRGDRAPSRSRSITSSDYGDRHRRDTDRRPKKKKKRNDRSLSPPSRKEKKKSKRKDKKEKKKKGKKSKKEKKSKSSKSKKKRKEKRRKALPSPSTSSSQSSYEQSSSSTSEEESRLNRLRRTALASFKGRNKKKSSKEKKTSKTSRRRTSSVSSSSSGMSEDASSSQGSQSEYSSGSEDDRSSSQSGSGSEASDKEPGTPATNWVEGPEEDIVYKYDEAKQWFPYGLSYVPNFITEEEERVILEKLEPIKWEKDHAGKAIWQAGPQIVHKNGEVVIDNSAKHRKFPSYVKEISNRLATKLNGKPNHLSIQSYKVGEGMAEEITPAVYGDTFAIIGIFSDIPMKFKGPYEDGQMKPPKADLMSFNLLLERRSCLVLTGKARHCWSREITLKHKDKMCSPGETRRRPLLRVNMTFHVLSDGEKTANEGDNIDTDAWMSRQFST